MGDFARLRGRWTSGRGRFSFSFLDNHVPQPGMFLEKIGESRGTSEGRAAEHTMTLPVLALHYVTRTRSSSLGLSR